MRCSSRFSTYHLNVRSVERSGNNLYAACAQFEGLGGKLRETELRGPNCDEDKESLRPPRDHSGTESDPIQNEEIERLSWSPDSAPTQARASLLTPSTTRSTTSSFYSKDREESEATTTSKHALGAPEEARDRLREAR